MISAAFFWPMPWMYWSAISTRLLVGIFTPAIRATEFSPVTGNRGRTFPVKRYSRFELVSSGRCPQTRTRRPNPLVFRGPASSDNYPIWMRGLLRDQTYFRQQILTLSSIFRDLFSAFPGLAAADALPSLGGLLGRLFGPFDGLADRFGGLFGRPGDLGLLGRGLLGGRLG